MKQQLELYREGQLIRIIVVLLLILVLSGCVPSSDPKPLNGEDPNLMIQVDWVEVNPPPGADGRCWAYFSRRRVGDVGYGYSGVWCR